MGRVEGMRIHALDPSVRAIWKEYPVRIPGGSKCNDCGLETILVQSLEGGFVTRNCPRCNKFESLPERVFRALQVWVACPRCKGRMAPCVLPDHNYGFECSHCDIGLPLFELVPRWQDL
jgi:hypothetical protein